MSHPSGRSSSEHKHSTTWPLETKTPALSLRQLVDPCTPKIEESRVSSNWNAELGRHTGVAARPLAVSQAPAQRALFVEAYHKNNARQKQEKDE